MSDKKNLTPSEQLQQRANEIDANTALAASPDAARAAAEALIKMVVNANFPDGDAACSVRGFTRMDASHNSSGWLVVTFPKLGKESVISLGLMLRGGTSNVWHTDFGAGPPSEDYLWDTDRTSAGNRTSDELAAYVFGLIPKRMKKVTS